MRTHGGLGRKYSPDPKDHAHLMSTALPAAIFLRPKSKTWRIWWKGNQGASPMCVGFSWHALLRSLPHLQRDPAPAVIYHEAQKIDEWDGEDPDSGTSVRAGAKVLQAAGKLVNYAWAFELETVLNWLAFNGPVVLGTTWTQRMFEPDATGLVIPGGAVEGGHAYTALGYSDRTKRILCQNSWGTDWGKTGRFYLRYEDADRLIRDDGEACTPTEAVEI